MVACRARLRLYRPGGQTFGEASAPGVTSQNRVVGCCPITILGRCINTVNINYIKGVWKTTVVTKVLRGWKDNQRQSLNQRQRWGHVNFPSTWLRAPTDGCAKALRLSTREGQRLWCLPQNRAWQCLGRLNEPILPKPWLLDNCYLLIYGHQKHLFQLFQSNTALQSDSLACAWLIWHPLGHLLCPSVYRLMHIFIQIFIDQWLSTAGGRKCDCSQFPLCLPQKYSRSTQRADLLVCVIAPHFVCSSFVCWLSHSIFFPRKLPFKKT